MAPAHLVQEVLQAAGLQGKPGHPCRLRGVQTCQGRSVGVPGHTLLRQVEGVDEVEDVSAGAGRLGELPPGVGLCGAPGVLYTCGGHRLSGP